MEEQICVNKKEILIRVEPHFAQTAGSGQAAEYFTASYSLLEAVGPGENLFTEEDGIAPKRFRSPVEALEYANEKLDPGFGKASAFSSSLAHKPDNDPNDDHHR